jgi:hypothetical protein
VIPYLKDLYKYYMNHVLYEAEHLFETMSKMFGIEIEVLKDYMPHELIALFEGKILDAEIVQQNTVANLVALQDRISEAKEETQIRSCYG